MGFSDTYESLKCSRLYLFHVISLSGTNQVVEHTTDTALSGGFSSNQKCCVIEFMYMTIFV